MPNAHKICKEMGIKLHGRKTKHRGFLMPKECFSPKTIYEVAIRGEKAGHDNHIYDCLKLFLSSEANSCQLYGYVINGVSKWLLTNGVSTDEIYELVKDFRDIEIQTVKDSVLFYRVDNRPSCVSYDISRLMEENLERVRRDDCW